MLTKELQAQRARASSPSRVAQRLPAPAARAFWALRALLMPATLALAACSTVGYLAQAAHGQWQLLQARRPIERVLVDPRSSAKLKGRLELVEDARAFAVKDLALPDNRSYRSYADLKRPYVVWNVVAAPRFLIEPLRWCFPIAGCIDYRGYFHEQRARAFAAALAARGDDVMVEGVEAYSTLGHFADPVLNTMLRYDDLELIGTIFHELTHQLLYVPGDSEFNESFAMAVEDEGIARWLAARGRSAELKRYLAQRRADQAIDEAFIAARRRLQRLYDSPAPLAQKAERKQLILKETGTQVLDLEERFGVHGEYDDWIAAGLNNAYLASIGTYYDCVPGFERLLREQGGQLPAFYAAVRAISRDERSRRRLCAPLSAAAPPNSIAATATAAGAR